MLRLLTLQCLLYYLSAVLLSIGHNRKAIYSAVTLIFSEIITTILKLSFGRSRPYEVLSSIVKLAKVSTASFPSGHTSAAFAVAMSLLTLFPEKKVIIIIAYFGALAVGYSRMALGVHYPSDVLGGAIIGNVATFICICGLKSNLSTKKV